MNNLHLELEFQQADFERLQTAWWEILQRHVLLQSYVSVNGQLATTPDPTYTIKLYDLSLQARDKIIAVKNKLRAAETLSSKTWPWFTLTATRYDSGNIRLYFSCARDMLSGEQVHYLLRELLALYQHPKLPIQSLMLQRPEQATKINDQAFTLRYHHLFGKLEYTTLSQLREQSVQHQLALPIVLLNAFRNELQQHNYTYPIYLSLGNRFPFYPFMYDRANFATSVASCAINDVYRGKFAENCQKVDAQLRAESLKVSNDNLNDLIHLPNNVNVMALFSCSLEQDLPAGPLFAKIPDVIYCNFNLPTVDIDYAVWEQGGQLLYRWSYVKALPRVDHLKDPQLLRNAFIEYPELKEIAQDNEAANKKSLSPLQATGLVLAGTAGATAAKGKSNSNKTSKAAALPLASPELLNQANQSNGAMKQVFDNYGQSLFALANSPNAWQAAKNQQPTTNNNSAQTQKTSYQNNVNAPNGSVAVAAAGGSAAGLLGTAIEALKNADKSAPDQPAAPSANEVALMDATQIDQAYSDYSQQVIQIHRAPSEADLAQQDICAQFSATAGEMGPDIAKMKTELTEMGGTIYQVSSNIARGDLQAAAAGLDKLGVEQANLVTKMNEHGVSGSINDNPLNKKASAVYDSANSLNANSSPDQIASLNDKVDSFDSALSSYSAPSPDAASAGAQQAAAEQIKAANEKIANSPEFQNTHAKADALKSLSLEVAKYDCNTIMQQASTGKIAELQQQAAELAQTIPPAAPSPLDAQIADVQAKAAAVQKRADELKNVSPEMAMHDPGLQAALGNLNTSADSMANNIQGQCPICSASKPNLPAVPTCGHNHADVMSVTNPFHVPQLQIDSSLSSLINLQNNSPQPGLPPIIDKLKSLKDKLQNLNPVPDMPTTPSPYAAVKAMVEAILQRVTSQQTNLANCPNYPAELKQKLTAAESSLTDSKNKLQTLLDGDNSSDTKSKMDALLQQMKDQMKGSPDGMKTAADQQRQQMLAAAQAEAMGKVTSSFACWQAMNMPGMIGGMPDEILVSGFKCKCPMSAGGPVSIMVKPDPMKINNKDALLIDGMPLTANMGACIHPSLIKPPAVTQVPCLSVLMALGGSTMSSNMNFPVATKIKTQLLCPATGTKMLILDSGQGPKDPVTTP